MCVILGAPTSNDKITDPTMMDKGVILATLNVRAMKFSEEERLAAEDEEGDARKQQDTQPRSTPRMLGSPKRFSVVSDRRNGYDVPVITDLSE